MKVLIFIIICVFVLIFIVIYRKHDSFSSYIEEGEPDDDEINSVEFFDIDE